MVRFAPDILDIPAVQAWLEDLAAKGQFLKDCITTDLASFSSGPPSPGTRYRLQPISKTGLSREWQETYREMGWTLVYSAREYHIWRCDDPSAPELDTDPVLQGEGYRALLRRIRLENRLLLLVLPLLAVFYLWCIWHRPQHFLEVNGFNAGQCLRFTLILACLAYSVGKELRIRRFAKKLREGLPQPQRRPYRLVRLWGLLPAVLLPLGLIAACFLQPSKAVSLPVSQWAEPVPYVSMAALDAESAPSTEPRAAASRNWLANRVWWVDETDGPAYCYTQYYDTRFAWTAERLVIQRQAEWLYLQRALEPLGPPAGLDEAWWQHTSGFGQILLVRRGNQVMEIRYTGGADLRDCLGQYEVLLAGFW